MRDGPQETFEALSWVKTLFEEQSTRYQGPQAILEEVDTILDRLQRGAAVDFSLKIG